MKQNLQLPSLSKSHHVQILDKSERTPTNTNYNKKASEALKTLNFHMNPALHKKKQPDQFQSNLIKKKSKVTRNIMELRRRKKLKSDSLSIHPRIQACKTVKGGTLSVLKNNEMSRTFLHKKYKDQIYTGTSDYSDKGKDKLRLSVVRWLIDNCKEVVSALNENRPNILEWVQCVDKIDRDEFDIVLHGINLFKDPNLVNRLFWVFDLNEDGYIEYNEIQYSINLFREYDQSDKVQIFFELCDENEDGYINENDIRKFFSKNLSNQDEIRTMKFFMKDFYQELAPSNIKGVTYDELYEATLSDNNIKIIVEKNTLILKQSNKKEDDIGASLNNLIYSGQYEGKQGVFYPQLEGMMNALAYRDQLMMYHQQLKMINELNEDHLE